MSDKNFGKLTFSLNELSYETMMFESWYKDGAWDAGELVSFRPIPLSPAANILNYGQGIFEGMKAYRSVKDRIVMFRPDDNAARFARSGAMLAMAVVNEDKFMDAVRQVVLANTDYIPDSDGGKYSFYLRPVSIATEAMLGVKPATEYLFYIYGSPVGPYFDKVGVVSLMVTDMHRAATNGIGSAKAVSNYVATMPPRQQAIEKGYDGALFLDTVHDTYVEEAGAANVFALMKDDTLVTPEVKSILPGITRDSIVKLAADMFGMKVEERKLSIDELCKNAKECFVCGTGAIITSVSKVQWKGEEYDLSGNNYAMAHRMYDKLTGIQLEREEDPYGWITEIK